MSPKLFGDASRWIQGSSLLRSHCHGVPTACEESSSSSESESSSSSSSSATNPKRSSEKKKKKKEKKLSSCHGTDLSTGDDKRIHEFEVSGVEIDKALAPAGLSTKDRSSIVEAAVDVAASPGVFSATHSQARDEAQGVTEAAATMLAASLGERAQLVHDTQWKRSLRTPWDWLRKSQTFSRSLRPFEQQDSRARLFLCQRKFDDDDIIDHLLWSMACHLRSCIDHTSVSWLC